MMYAHSPPDDPQRRDEVVEEVDDDGVEGRMEVIEVEGEVDREQCKVLSSCYDELALQSIVRRVNIGMQHETKRSFQ